MDGGPMERLTLETQTLYAEFLAQLLASAPHRSIGRASGCFTRKTVKGETYYYFQYSDPGGYARQAYVGKRTPELDHIVHQFQQERSDVALETRRVQRLCAQLRIGGALHTDPAPARILKAFADAGVFQLGGVLIGTHAFALLGNMLGIHWRGAFLKTHDIDIAGHQILHIALPDIRADVPKVLESLQMGFLPVPPNPKHPSVSYKVRGTALRVDFVTPQHGSRSGTPVLISRFNLAAQPLPNLGYLLEDSQPSGVVNGGGVLVTVPNPARYAFHKLLISRLPPVTDHAKAEKDLHQAAQLIEVLASDRPGDLQLAWTALIRKGAGSRKKALSAITVLKTRFPEIHHSLLAAIPALQP
jgi:hypothetical protein